MNSSELWFSSSDEEDQEEVCLRRRRIRDNSNPLEMSNIMFRQYFRISKEVFTYLLNIMESKMKPPIGSHSVSPLIKLTGCLRFFAEGSYQKGAGNDQYVGLSQSNFSKALSEIINIFETEICPSEIKFPSTEEEKNDIRLAFYKKTGFPGVIGCVDGTHVKIFPPSHQEQHLYYNRKGFHSLNVMLICDHNLRVRYVDASHPGSCHDSFVWNGSSLDSHLKSNYINGERNSWLLGDSGYPLKPYLITPYRSPDSITLNNFNAIHSKARITIERTIGVMKNSFRCLMGQRSLHYKPDKAKKIVNAICALHNLRVKFNEDLEEYVSQEEQSGNEVDVQDEDPDIRVQAVRIRDGIMSSISRA